MKNHAYELCYEAGIEPTSGALVLVDFIDDVGKIIKKVVNFMK